MLPFIADNLTEQTFAWLHRLFLAFALLGLENLSQLLTLNGVSDFLVELAHTGVNYIH